MSPGQSYLNFNINQVKRVKPRVLVAPLDWGLGHATRCVPVIRELQRQGCEVSIASTAPVSDLLTREFPDVSFLDLPGYNIRYATSARRFGWKLIRQLPKIRSAIAFENSWLNQKIDEFGFDAVVSDNRFGLYHPAVRTVFITHQLLVKSPFGRWTERILQNWNYQYINRFNTCWVPDFGDEINLAGELSHPRKKPSIPVEYIGPLSRLTTENSAEKKITSWFCFLVPSRSERFSRTNCSMGSLDIAEP